MKFIRYSLFAILSVILLTNCDKVAEQNELTTAVTRATFNDVTPSERLNIYFKLSTVQKLNLWKSKLSQSAAQPVSELQREAILSLENKLSEELFNQNDIDIFENELLMEWLNRYGDYFTDMEGMLIFGDLADFNSASTSKLGSTRTYKDLLMADKQQSYNNSKEVEDSVSARSQEDCTCRHGAYCQSPGDCTEGNCQQTECCGCGWLWLQRCNGRCGEDIYDKDPNG